MIILISIITRTSVVADLMHYSRIKMIEKNVLAFVVISIHKNLICYLKLCTVHVYIML